MIIRYLSLIILSVAVFASAYYYADLNTMALAIIFLLSIEIVYCLVDVNKNVTLLMFLVSFSTFLLGRIVLPLFSNIEDTISKTGEVFSLNTNKHIYLSLFLSLLFVFGGFLISNKKNYGFINTTTPSVAAIRKAVKKLCLFSFIFAVIITAEKVYMMFTQGYYALYVDYHSKLPYIITILGSFYYYAFYIYLATLPSKSEAKLVIVSYMFIITLSLGTGQRGSFVLGLFFIITYFIIRNDLAKGEKPWITKKALLYGLLSMPLLVLALFAIAYIRLDADIDTSSNIFLYFLYQQGVSAEVIGYTYDYEKYFPEGRIYILGDIIDYLKHNMFSQFLFGTDAVEPQSVKHALDDHSLDAALTYFVKPYLYLEGGGLGGCYIAEAWKDLGYIGVCFVNIIYGWLLAKIRYWGRTNIWKFSIGLIMFSQIIFAPRAHAIKFISVFTSVGVLLIYFYLYIINRNVSYEKSKVNLQQKSV
jgi:oligosaccharide repeat unit polymerase